MSGVVVMSAEDYIALIVGASISLMAITREPGVLDLPGKVKGTFAQAVRAERRGDNETASQKLDEAVALETEYWAAQRA